MFSREICDVKHPMIKDADELLVFSYKQNNFRLINRAEYPKPKGAICELCPNGMRRTNDTVVQCYTKVDTWSTFKSHLVTVERIFGELVAFPADTDENNLPDLSIYSKKHRAYGQLVDYQDKEQIYIYDVRENKFIYVQRNALSRLYTKFGSCNYCGNNVCLRRVQSPSSIMQHLQSIENRFFCYLVLDNESQNDRRNKEKIQIFVNSIQKNESNKRSQDEFQSIKPSNRSSINHSKSFNQNTDEEQSESSEYLSINEDAERMICNGSNEQENLKIINQMEKSFKKDTKEMNFYLNQLKSKINVTSIDQSLINSQEQLNISKRLEDPETKEKQLTFTKKLKLDNEDLSLLLSKYGVPETYKIKNVEINLNLNLKPKNEQEFNNLPEDLYESDNSIDDKLTDDEDPKIDLQDTQDTSSEKSIVTYLPLNGQQIMNGDSIKIKQEVVEDCESVEELVEELVTENEIVIESS